MSTTDMWRFCRPLRAGSWPKTSPDPRPPSVRTGEKTAPGPISASSFRAAACGSKAGLFRLGGALVGAAAFRRQEGELGSVPGCDDIAQTDDADIVGFERLSSAIARTELASASRSRAHRGDA
ncbi:MAG: hypothetical protein KGS00_07265 [Alphaproteobacteria bacterium]|nr:hypothetical protein [Alphaproteobacteria bacterium]